MKALRLFSPGQPLQLQEIPDPQPDTHDLLVRVHAAGVCHSDAHYRSGISPVGPLPVTLGHEVSGIVEQAGDGVQGIKIGSRVCIHYLITCGKCSFCKSGNEQFCRTGEMIGKHRDGGYAEYILVPKRNAVLLPQEISFEHGALLMCSSSTCLHALKKARLSQGESVAVFGVGGLGMSAIQLAKALGAGTVYAVDINKTKLQLAERLGAQPIDGSSKDAVPQIRLMTNGRGVDVALELVGLSQTASQAVRSLGVHGRAVMVGLTDKTFDVQPYTELIGKEAEIIGSSDHLLTELPVLLDLVRKKKLDLSDIVSETLPLDAKEVNRALDNLVAFNSGIRSVIKPVSS